MKSGILSLFVALFFTACTQKEQAPEFSEPDTLPAVQVLLSQKTPKIGERMDLTVRVSAEERLVLPPVSDWLDPSVEVLENESMVLENEDHWVKEYHLQLSLFQVTNLTLFAETQVTTLSETPIEIPLPFERIEVAATLTEEDTSPKFGEDTLPDFRGPEALKRQKRNLIISAIATVVFFLLLAVTAWILSRRKKPAPPPTPPHLIALREIELLTQSSIWQKPDVDASAVGLSLILRHYIEGAFHIRAPEQTTEEFLELAQTRSPWGEENQSSLKEFFRVTDQIKYAGSRPDNQVLQDLLQATTSFVESTRPQNGGPA